jgi:Ca-activated chloride channel family protein
MRFVVFAAVFFLGATVFSFEEKVDVDLVDLYLTATDSYGNFVVDLRPDDLFLQEDGHPQKILEFGNSGDINKQDPLNVVLMVDNSISMLDDLAHNLKIEVARQIGLNILEQLQPADKMMLVTFNETSQIVPLTSNRDRIRAQLDQTYAVGRDTALYDALVTTADAVKTQPGQKVIVLCSDGIDNESHHTLKEVYQRMANSPDISILVLGIVPPESVNGKHILEQLAEQTAGSAYFPKTAQELQRVRDLILDFIRSRYSIAYRSANSNLDGSWRNIQITCKRKDLKLNYRHGYFAR